jgi:hypothetical protein
VGHQFRWHTHDAFTGDEEIAFQPAGHVAAVVSGDLGQRLQDVAEQ